MRAAACLQELYPNGQYCIGCDSGIYWRWTYPVLDGCKAPDWFLVPNVPPMLDGTYRRSYVLWQEAVKPLMVVEFVSGDGSEERDTEPYKGKFWVYEQAICASFYAIYEVEKASVEVYRLHLQQYQPVAANAAGRFPIEPLGIELGIWEGTYRGLTLPWLRVWDAATGELMPLADERTRQRRAFSTTPGNCSTTRPNARRPNANALPLPRNARRNWPRSSVRSASIPKRERKDAVAFRLTPSKALPRHLLDPFPDQLRRLLVHDVGGDVRHAAQPEFAHAVKQQGPLRLARNEDARALQIERALTRKGAERSGLLERQRGQELEVADAAAPLAVAVAAIGVQIRPRRASRVWLLSR